MNEIITPKAEVLQGTFSPAVKELFDSFQKDYFPKVKEATAQNYAVGLRCFLEWLFDNEITHPTKDDINMYIVWLSLPHPKRTRTAEGQKPEEITFSAGTQALYLRSVKIFFEWTEDRGLYKNIAKGTRGAKVNNRQHKRDAFDKDDIKPILNSIDRTTEAGKRDYSMFCLGFFCSMRIIEMKRANVGNIEIKNGIPYLYVQHKGHDEADDFHELPPEVYEAIQDYLKSRGKVSATSPLFVGTGNRNRGRLAEPTISKIIKDRLKAAGYNSHRLTAHSTRHTSITALYNSGGNIKDCQTFAGHASPQPTGIYIHDQDRKNKHYEVQVYNYLMGDEISPSQRIDSAANTAKSLSYTTQQILADEIEKLVNKYRDIERGV